MTGTYEYVPNMSKVVLQAYLRVTWWLTEQEFKKKLTLQAVTRSSSELRESGPKIHGLFFLCVITLFTHLLVLREDFF
jgi:hypothetical protein